VQPVPTGMPGQSDFDLCLTKLGQISDGTLLQECMVRFATPNGATLSRTQAMLIDQIDLGTTLANAPIPNLQGRQRCLDAGMDAYLSKPIDLRKCLELVREMVGTSICAGSPR
jgi:CheY-like chemotaxis protein